MHALELMKLLADETRLVTVLLVRQYGELCVCELTEALDLSQPKVSRHLAQLRTANLLFGEKRGQWVYYRIHPDLDGPARNLIDCLANGYSDLISPATRRLSACQPGPTSPGCCQPRENAEFN